MLNFLLQKEESKDEKIVKPKFVKLLPRKKNGKPKKKPRKSLKKSTKNFPKFRISRNKLVLRCLRNRLGSKIRCRHCKKSFQGQRNYYNHFLSEHLPKNLEDESVVKILNDDTNGEEEEEDKLVIDEGKNENKMEIDVEQDKTVEKPIPEAFKKVT